MSAVKFLLKDFVETRFKSVAQTKLDEMIAKAKLFDYIGINAFTMLPVGFVNYFKNNQTKLPVEIAFNLKENNEMSWTEFLINKDIANFLNQRMMGMSSFIFRQKLAELSDSEKRIMKQDVELIAQMFKMVEKIETEQQPLRYVQIKTNIAFENQQDTNKLIEEHVIEDE